VATTLATRAVALLREADVPLEDGLDSDEFRAVQRRFGFEFGPDHADLLRLALPVGDGWPDWRRDAESDLRKRLAWPVEGAVHDVLHNGFWPASWGARPLDDEVAEKRAREQLSRWPKLVPVYGHRYLPAAPSVSGAPVLSVYQTDVIYYGADLVDYLRRELQLDPAPREEMKIAHLVPRWSALTSAPENDEL
jgi:hypothetical protein